MQIQFDEKNLLADVIGKENGLTRAEVERAESKARRALKSFRRQSEQGLYGFPHLPFQEAVIRAAIRHAENCGAPTTRSASSALEGARWVCGRSIAAFAGHTRCKAPSQRSIHAW